MTPKLAVGSLAYFDSFSGLIPCKVIRIDGPAGRPSSEQQVTFRITAKTTWRLRGYKRGEIMTEWALHVVPREAVSFRDYSARIGFYEVEGSMS